jgi:hypothetical protein
MTFPTLHFLYHLGLAYEPNIKITTHPQLLVILLKVLMKVNKNIETKYKITFIAHD